MAWRKLLIETPDPETAMADLVRFLAPQVANEIISHPSLDHPPDSNDGFSPTDAQLARAASAIYKMRQRRGTYFGEALFAEPAWGMLLGLFINYIRDTPVLTTSLCLSAHAPPATALRYVEILEQHGLGGVGRAYRAFGRGMDDHRGASTV